MTQTATSLASRIIELQRQKKAAHAQMTKIAQLAKAEGRELNASEEARFERLKAETTAVNGVIDDLLNGAMGNAGNSSNGFANLGDFGIAVAKTLTARKTGTPADPRLLAYMGGPQAAAPGTAANEAVGADGGFALPPQFAKELFLLSLDEDSLLPLCDEIPVAGTGMFLPKDETTPWGTEGVRSFWQGELSVATPTKPVFTGTELKLKKLMGLVPVSSELLQDSDALAAYLPQKLASSIRWKANAAILFGSGSGQPLGALSGSAPIVVAKDAGQAALTLSATNLATMYARLPPGSQQRSVWLINNDVLPALLTLTLGNAPLFVPTGGGVASIAGAPVGTIFGRPVLISQQPNTFGSQGDVLLLDLSYYIAITKAAGMQMATSMHLYFDADALAFRITFRMDGAPKITRPIAPNRGAFALSPFVQLAAR